MGARMGWRANLLVAAFWVVGLYGVVKALPSAAQHPTYAAAFLVMTIVFSLLRVPTGKGEVSVGALVSFLSVTVLGALPAVGIKLLGTFMAGATHRTETFQNWRSTFINTAIFSMTVLLSGLAYRAAGGGLVTAVFGVREVPAFLAMAVVYTPANILLIAAVRWLANRPQAPTVFAVDRIKRLGVNAILFAAVGLVGEAIFAEMRLMGLLVVFGLMLAVRFTFQIYGETQRFRSEMAGMLAQTLAFKDPYTGAHSARVAELSVRIGEELGLSDLQQEKLRDSALLHDIGKVAVPDAVLVKPGPLDEDEWQAMSRHVGAGGELLERSPYLRELADYVRAHHSDFEAQSAEGEPPLEARIIAVADAYDAMTSDRPYRPALPQAEAARRLEQAAGTQFDPVVVHALLRSLQPPANRQIPAPGAGTGKFDVLPPLPDRPAPRGAPAHPRPRRRRAH